MTSIAIGSDEESQSFLGEISPFYPPIFYGKWEITPPSIRKRQNL